ncbi:hypothetical protein HME7025_00067 [Aquirufa nivalisilvae]|uniref:Uncharacterized protein n=1 Tax=Aquirufa nivalisilvae TaxID=2516557 RepID=A0A2S2DRL6_9BACT|nr:hypothetical protein [Aquirufa nivalisilvae]AWL07952.1 hypothetical protein HME7025_00067 [Aquirufa nivalisilvae]
MEKSATMVGPHIISVEHWRERYLNAKNRIEKECPISVIRVLINGDKYYDSVNGINDYKNVSQGKAGIEKTSKVVLTLEKYLSRNDRKRNRSTTKIS